MSSKCGRTWPRCNTLLQIDETITIRYIPCLVYACVCVTSRSAMNFSLVKRAVPVLTRWSEEGNVDDGGELLMEMTSSSRLILFSFFQAVYQTVSRCATV